MNRLNQRREELRRYFWRCLDDPDAVPMDTELDRMMLAIEDEAAALSARAPEPGADEAWETFRQELISDCGHFIDNAAFLRNRRIIEAALSVSRDTLEAPTLRRALMERDLVVLDTRDYGGMRMSDTAAADAIAAAYARLSGEATPSAPDPEQ